MMSDEKLPAVAWNVKKSGWRVMAASAGSHKDV
jgi:hypothetical protein